MRGVWNLKEQFATSEEDFYKNPADFFDCQIAEFLLSEGKYFFTQETTLKKYGVDNLDALAELQDKALQQMPAMHSLFRDIEMPLIPILWRMEQYGINIDRTQLESLGVLLDREINAVVAEIDAETGTPINLSSPLQVGKMLVETFKVPLAKTSTGKFATGEPELMKHAAGFPIITKLLKYRQLTKLKSTYVEGLLKKIGTTGRIHTTYNQAVVVTGRLSSSNPNLQNIPANSEIGKQIKSCFIPSPGHILVGFDYSQQELRILAHITKEPVLIQAFEQGQDIHAVTAAKLFRVPLEQVSKDQRNAAKTINFGVLYGMGSFGLSQALEISVAEAETFIADFFKNFAEVRKFYFAYIAEAGKQKYAESLLGRRRFVAVLDNATRRELANYPIQGAAADLMKKTMVDVNRELLQSQPDVHLMLQIHDELVFEIPDKGEQALNTFVSSVKHIMEHVYELAVPMKIEAKVGKNWGEMTPF